LNTFKNTLLSADFWLGLVYLIFFCVVWQVVEILLWLLVIAQVGCRLFGGGNNPQLAGWGNSLSQYVWQTGRFVSGASEQKPWPFMEWPAANAQWRRDPVVDAAQNQDGEEPRA